MSLTLLEAAKAKLEGKRVEFNEGTGWYEWAGVRYFEEYTYRIAPEPKKKVKFLCWLMGGVTLSWHKEGIAVPPDWERVPSEDKEGEVEE